MLDDFIGWLKACLAQEFDKEALAGWVFGSSLQADASPHDVDVLLVVRDTEMEHLARVSANLRKGFLRLFHIPLHLTRLTTSEFENHRELVNVLFKHGCRRIR